MPIWKLEPVTTSASDDAWAFTVWHGPILVRARDARQARAIAAVAFSKVDARRTGARRTTLTSPWLNDGLVACRRVLVSAHLPDGPEEILEPPKSEYNRG